LTPTATGPDPLAVPPILEARAITKRFPGVLALDRVDAAFGPGEVVAVVGENGAGKSTLMKVLAGVYTKDSGEVRVDGEPVEVSSVRRATELGIAFIHQELNLADNLSAAANLFLGRERTRGGVLKLLDDRWHRARAAEVFARLGLRIDPSVRVRELGIGHQQMVEIAKALSQDARVLIMDEPTSSLTQHETDTLLGLVRELRDGGMCVVFISHRLAEVERVADRVIVLRDGRNSGELERREIAHDRIVSLMVGRDLDVVHRPPGSQCGDPVLEVEGLRTRRFPDKPVRLRVRAGETVVLAGLIGAGRSELLRAVAGVDRRAGGLVVAGGRTVPGGSPRAAIRAGIALVPEDRKAAGVIVGMSLRDNVALPALGEFARAGFVSGRAVDRAAEEVRERFGVRASSVRQVLGTLSGGNQQKVAIGKWARLKPAVFLLDEPTRGVDVRSRGEIYKAVEALAAEGAGVLVASSDLEEVLRIADRVLVMHEGAVAGELVREELTEEKIMALATGAAARR
jgi:ribose transport system ATP-binding protein